MGVEAVTTTISFVSFTLLISLIMLDMYIMVILQQWEILANEPQYTVHIFKEHLRFVKRVYRRTSLLERVGMMTVLLRYRWFF
jgi:hypothetical protein